MVSPRLKADVKVGDAVQVGVLIQNSEVRCSAVQVTWFLKRLVCLNGMVVSEPGARGAFRRHVGRDWNNGEISPPKPRFGRFNDNGSGQAPPLSYGLIPDNLSRQEWERSVWREFQDSLRQHLRVEAMTALIERLTRTTTMWSGLAPQAIAERVAQRYQLSAGEQDSFLYHLTVDGDLTLWGVLNAVTRSAEAAESYARATSMEESGGVLAQLSPREWDRLVSPN